MKAMTLESQSRPVALSLAVLGTMARLIPHPPNFAPVGAASVFAGARLPAWQAYLVPVVIMAATDPILNAMNGLAPFTISQLFIYSSLLISVWLGRRLRATESAWRIGAIVLLASTQFFVISNLPSWFRWYPHTFAGLASCLATALPFFERTLASDVVFSALLFGMHFVLSRTVAGRERIPATC